MLNSLRRVTYSYKDAVHIRFRPPPGLAAQDPFTDWINRVQKYVVSDTLTEKDAIWNPTTIIRGPDFLKTVSELRARPGGYIYVYGSAAMVRSLN